MRTILWCAALTLLGISPAPAAADAKTARETAFGTYRTVSPEAARSQAEAWLKSVGKSADAAFQAIWESDRPVLDKVADTLALGSPEAARILADCRNADQPAPLGVPAALKDAKNPEFFRANLALAYAKALAGRRVFEEALEALTGVRPEQVVDPSAFFFHKAVAEHGLLLRSEATASIQRLLDDVADAPDRYKMVAALMFFDMQSWKEKDLAAIGRKMTNIERRLELARGGPQTQRMQREVVSRLDELIKQLEKNQPPGGS